MSLGLFIYMEDRTWSLEPLTRTRIGHPNPSKLKRGDCTAVKWPKKIYSGYLFAVGTLDVLQPISTLIEAAFEKQPDRLDPCNWKHENLNDTIQKLLVLTADSDSESSCSSGNTFFDPPAKIMVNENFRYKIKTVTERTKRIQLDLCTNIAIAQRLHEEKVRAIVFDADMKIAEQMQLLNSLI